MLPTSVAQRRSRLRLALLAAFALPALQVLPVRFVDPPFTLTMLQRVVERRVETGEWRWVDHRPGPLSSLGPHLPRAAVASEDALFWHHHGFDVGAICSAIQSNEKGKGTRGGSTISQQVAKNVFLWQHRDWVRKGLEVVYTAWLELLVPKERILELYLQVAETGPMTFGAEAGALRAFGKPSRALDADEARRLVGILPAPRTWTVQSRGQRRPEPVAFPGDSGFKALGPFAGWDRCW